MKSIIVDRFDGGMRNEPRLSESNACRIAKHFDLFTDEGRLIPHYTQESGDASADTNQIANFAYDGTNIYGLGIADATPAVPKLFKRTDFSGTTWTADSGGTIAGAARTDADIPAFVYYRNQGELYGVRAGQYIWSAVFDSSVNITEADLTSYTTVSNFLVHSKDDICYLGYDNKIASKDGSASFNVTALTLPTQYIITSLSEYGDFLAIACRHKGGGNSRVFLWNRDETSTLLSSSIDWGPGNLMLIEELEGYLVGVSYEGDTAGGANVGQTRVVFRAYSGAGGAIKFEEFTGFSQSPAIQSTLYKQKQRSRILFPATIPITGIVGAQSTGNTGIWAISRKNGRFVITQEFSYLVESTPQTRHGFLQIGDFLFASYEDNGTFYQDKTNENVVYTQTSIYESLINPGMPKEDVFKKKRLHSVAVFTEKLISGQQVVLKYKVDGGSFSSALITKTSSSPDSDLIGYELPPNNQLTYGREFEFRLESTGGAVITGFAYSYEDNLDSHTFG